MTNLDTAFSRPDEDPEPLGLEDVIRMVAGLALDRRLGRDWRRRALALTDAAAELESMSGLVIDGQVYDARHHQDWAPCGCKNKQHQYIPDNPWFARSHWTETRADAAELTAKYRGHLVTRLTATTPIEEVKP